MYRLIPPATPEQWSHYHAIRRRVLWEQRGHFGTYNDCHPDEHRAGHHPLLLLWHNKPIGVIRIDITGERAILRRMAIHEDYQRSGHGRHLMQLAEALAQETDQIFV
jgi:GNAT superfamily N-acetyltransferase